MRNIIKKGQKADYKIHRIQAIPRNTVTQYRTRHYSMTAIL